MRRLLVAVIVGLALAWGSVAAGQDWGSHPSNWQNHPNNWENNPNNWKNNPNNWQNSPNRWGNERVIRDNQGNAKGYVVPRSDGGVNIFDFQGNRRGYAPGRW